MRHEKFLKNRVKKQSSDEIEVISFYSSLNVELNNFALPIDELLKFKLLVKEKRDEKIVGIAGISDNNLLFIVVKNEFQNQKIGQRLMAKLIMLAKQRKCHYIALNVFASNVKAFHIYRKFGFKVITSNMLNFRKNFFMILSLDLRGRIYEVLLRVYFKFGSYSKAWPPILRKIWRLFRSLFY